MAGTNGDARGQTGTRSVGPTQSSEEKGCRLPSLCLSSRTQPLALDRARASRWLDVSCRTDHRPRPQILICTKTMESYNRRLNQYRKDLAHLEAVEAMEKGLRQG